MLYQLLRQVLFTHERDVVALGETCYTDLEQSLRAGEYQNALR